MSTKLMLLAMAVGLAGCASTGDEQLRSQVRVLQMQVDAQHEQIEQLAQASIQNSQSIKRNSESIITISHVLDARYK